MTPSAPIRVRPAPLADGPYDDEPADPRPPVIAGSLALALPGVTAPPAVPLRLVPPARPPQSGGAPAPLGHVVRRLGQAIAEVLVGCRSAAQLADFATYDVLCQLERSAGRLAPRSGPAPVPRLTSVHVSEPVPRTAEVCLVLDTGRRRRAVALRLEAPGRRWRCTALQIG